MKHVKQPKYASAMTSYYTLLGLYDFIAVAYLECAKEGAQGVWDE